MNSDELRIAAVVLAAGESKRFGKANKLLHTVGGRPLARIALEALGSIGLVDCVVVLGHEADRVANSLEGLEARYVTNPDYHSGMGSSLSRGVAELDLDSLDGLLVCVADLPKLKGRHVEAVVRRFAEDAAQRVVVPVYAGVRGHPVCFPKRMLTDLRKLSGDEGAKGLVNADPLGPVLFAMKDDACIQDLDELRS